MKLKIKKRIFKNIAVFGLIILSINFFTGCSCNNNKNEKNVKGTVIIIALKAWNGKYVSVCNDSTGFKLIADKDKIGEREKFSMEYYDTNIVIFKAINNLFVCADYGKGNYLLADKMIANDWERYIVEDSGNNKVAFKSSNGKYVCADQSISFFLIADKDHASDWEQFTIEKIK